MRRYFFVAGGFGNLLFQYVAFRFLQGRGKQDLHVHQGLISKNYITQRVLKWHIHESAATKLFGSEEGTMREFSLPTCLRLLSLILSKRLGMVVFRSVFVKTEDVVLPQNCMSYMGYFQNISIYDGEFKDYIEEVKDRLSIRAPVKRVCVHLRFGDSDWARKYVDYYDRIREVIEAQDSLVFFISDDTKRCIEFAESCSVTYQIIQSSMLEEFRFLAESSVCLCAPSTFSWWAAVLNAEIKESVYMPEFFELRFEIDYPNTTFL